MSPHNGKLLNVPRYKFASFILEAAIFLCHCGGAENFVFWGIRFVAPLELPERVS